MGKGCYTIFKTAIKEGKKVTHWKNKRYFLHQCLRENLTPNSLRFNLPGSYKYDYELYRTINRRLLHKEIGKINKDLHATEGILVTRLACL